jgi:hypothetical protein
MATAAAAHTLGGTTSNRDPRRRIALRNLHRDRCSCRTARSPSGRHRPLRPKIGGASTEVHRLGAGPSSRVRSGIHISMSGIGPRAVRHALHRILLRSRRSTRKSLAFWDSAGPPRPTSTSRSAVRCRCGATSDALLVTSDSAAVAVASSGRKESSLVARFDDGVTARLAMSAVRPRGYRSTGLVPTSGGRRDRRSPMNALRFDSPHRVRRRLAGYVDARNRPDHDLFRTELVNLIDQRGDRRRAAIRMPNFSSSSLAIRSSPHKRFSLAILRISARSSFGIGGRPGRDFMRHRSRQPARCQRIMVAG